MDSINVKAVLDYPVYLKLKSEQDKSNIAANTINSDLGANTNISTYHNGASAVPAEQFETPGPRGGRCDGDDKINNEYVERNPESLQDHDSNDGCRSRGKDSDSDESDTKTDDENNKSNARDFEFVYKMSLHPRYEKKAFQLIGLLGLDPQSDTYTIDNELYTREDLKSIFYQLYVKRNPKYAQTNKKLQYFLKSLADRDLFNIIKNRSLLSNYKKEWYLLI